MPYTVYKPAGLPVFPWHRDPTSDCVLARLRRERPDVDAHVWPPGFEGGIAHRLDVSTSGALWVAETSEELTSLRDAFRSKRLTKTYRFETEKTPNWTENRCDRPIAHAKRHKRRMVVQRGPSTAHRGKWYEAETRFRQLDERLWEAVITTGVMHQIRVHAAFVGLVLRGDSLYGGGPALNPEEGVSFRLHHVGLTDGMRSTDPVSMPSWAVSRARP